MTNEVMDEVKHLEVRYFLFDTKRKVTVSSVQICCAKLLPPKDRSAPAISQNWSIPEAQKTLLIRSKHPADYDLVIELVSLNAKDPSKQVTVAWAKTPLFHHQASKKDHKLKLPLVGGSPFSASSEIHTSENEQKKKGFFKALMQPKGQVVDRHITLDVKQFEKLDQEVQAQLSLMPEDLILWKSLIGFATAFRIYAYDKLLKNEVTMKKP